MPNKEKMFQRENNLCSSNRVSTIMYLVAFTHLSQNQLEFVSEDVWMGESSLPSWVN